MTIAEAQNPLEESLKAAVEDDSRRGAFYMQLLRSELFVVGRIEGEHTQIDGGRATVEGDARLVLHPAMIEDELVLPVYTSRARIEQATDGAQPYLGLPALDILRAKPPDIESVIVNPGVWYGVALGSREVSALLDGSVPGESGSYEVAAGGELVLGEPADYPVALADELSRFFAATGAVTRAHLAQVFDPNSNVPPHPIVGIEVVQGARLDDVLAGVEDVVTRIYGGPVDFVALDDRDVSAWLVANTEPFFVAEPQPRARD